MPFLLQHDSGRVAIRLHAIGWRIEFQGEFSDNFASDLDAKKATCERRTGIALWDCRKDPSDRLLTPSAWIWVDDLFEHLVRLPDFPVPHRWSLRHFVSRHLSHLLRCPALWSSASDDDIAGSNLQRG